MSGPQVDCSDDVEDTQHGQEVLSSWPSPPPHSLHFSLPSIIGHIVYIGVQEICIATCVSICVHWELAMLWLSTSYRQRWPTHNVIIKYCVKKQMLSIE